MANMKKPEGSHKFLNTVVCNRCGHKEQWRASGLMHMRLHIEDHQKAETAPAPVVGTPGDKNSNEEQDDG